MTKAVISETPPWAATKGGLALSSIVESGGAVRYAPSQLARATATAAAIA